MMSPVASIIVLAHNQLAYTAKCIESLVNGTTMPVEFILVDNGSSDNTYGICSQTPYQLRYNQSIRIIRSENNLGFAGGNNLGIAVARGHHIVLMNNDIVVPVEWLDRMIACISAKPKAGIVGPMSNSVSGPQMVDHISYDRSTLEGLAEYADAFSRRNRGRDRRVLRLVGFCMLIRRDVIERIGGLDTLYGLGNFEDDDFCLRSAISGYEAYIAQDCFVHHFGSRTFAGEKIDYRQSLNQNWEKFKRKWELPIELPYGVPYRIDTVLRRQYSRQQLFCPLPDTLNNESILIVGAPDHDTCDLQHNNPTQGEDGRPEGIDVAQAGHQGGLRSIMVERRISYPQAEDEPQGKKTERDPYTEKGNVSIVFFPVGKMFIDALCLENMIRVTPEPIELIVTSSDLKRFSKKLKSFVLHNPMISAKVLDSASRPLGFLNAALRVAQGEQVALLRGDAVVGPGWLEGLLTCCMHDEEYGIAGVVREPISPDDYRDVGLMDLMPKLLARSEDFRSRNRYRRLRTDRIDQSCFFMSKKVFEELGGFDETIGQFPGMIDDFVLRCEMKGYRPTVAGDVLVFTAEGHKAVGDRREIERKGSNVINPQSPAGKSLALVATLRQATDRERRGRVNQAVDLLLKAIGTSPESANPYIALARIMLRSKRYDDALETLNEIPRGKVAEEVKLIEGYAHEGMGDLESAETAAAAVLSRNGCCASAMNLKGLVMFQRGDIAAAEFLFREAIHHDPGFGEPYSNLGAMRLKQEDCAEALALQEKAFILSPDEPDIVNNYHALIVAMGAMGRAEPLAREALSIYPMCKKIRHFLIDLLVQRQLYPQAMDEIERAIVDFGSEDGILSAALKIRNKIGSLSVSERSPKKAAVSLCMIVKNEAKFLARCLHSLKPIVAEMIVVDTGSDDHTREIATAFGAQLHEIAWPNDFSAARNYAMDQARGDWILIMDGDEVISPSDHEAFRKLVDDRSVWPGAYLVTTRNYQRKTNTIGWMPNSGDYPDEEAGFGWIPTTKVRLVSNDRRLRFSYPVHEMLDPSLIEAKVPVRTCDIPVHHYGKLDEVRCHHKGEAYFELGMRKLEQMGDSEIALRELATEAGLLGHHEAAIGLWQRYLDLKPNSRFVLDAHVNMATAYGKLGRFDEAVRAAGIAVRIDPLMKEAQYSLAYAELHRGEASAAAKILAPLVERHPLFPPARFILAATHFCQGRNEEGNVELSKLLSMPMGKVLVVAFHALAKELFEAGRLEYAVCLLKAAVDNNHLNEEVLNLLLCCLKEMDRGSSGRCGEAVCQG